MIIQTLDYTSTIAKKYLKKHPSARLSTLYRLIRKRPDHFIIGCWPIISELFFTVVDNYRQVLPREVASACRASDDSQLKKVRTDSQIISNLLKQVEL